MAGQVSRSSGCQTCGNLPCLKAEIFRIRYVGGKERSFVVADAFQSFMASDEAKKAMAEDRLKVETIRILTEFTPDLERAKILSGDGSHYSSLSTRLAAPLRRWPPKNTNSLSGGQRAPLMRRSAFLPPVICGVTAWLSFRTG